jgi:hypothetical protein
MLLDATTDNLEIVLDKAVTANQLDFAVFYNEYTSTSVTPSENLGTTNNTTPVNLIPSPSAGNQRQLRWCSINNVDTGDNVVKIRFNDNGSYRTVLYVYLRTGESIQYSEEMGWRVYDQLGNERTNGFNRTPATIKMPEWFGSSTAATTVDLTNTNCFCTYLGRADRIYSSVKIQYQPTILLTGTVSWAELAIYKGTPVLSSPTTMTRLGFTDTSSIWNTGATGTAGNRTTTVTTTGMNIGDDLYAVFSNSTTGTVTQLRAGLADNLASGVYQTVSNTRPSTNSSITGTVDSTTAMIWMAWEGVYQGT